MTDSSLDNLLDGTADKATPEAKTEPVQSAPIAEAPPTSEPNPGETPDPAAPPAASLEKNDGPSVPRKALEDERRKRQDLERQLQDLTTRFQSQPPAQQSPQPTPAERPQRPDPWIDPEGAMAWDRQEIDNQMFNTRVAMSRELMMAKPDFLETEALFLQVAQHNPHLKAQLRAHPLPAQFAYEQGRRLRALQEIGDDPTAYRTRIEEEIRAKLAQEPQDGQGNPSPPVAPQPSVPRTPAPKSLAGTPSQQPRDSRGRYAGPASLDDILGG